MTETKSLLKAADQDNLPDLVRHLENGCDINQVNAMGKSALHIAAKLGHTEIVKKLIEKGCDVNLLDKKHRTALHHACRNDLVELANALIEAGVKIHALDNKRQTALHVAAAKGHTGVIEAIISSVNKLYIQLKNEDRKSAVELAAEDTKCPAAADLLKAYKNPKARMSLFRKSQIKGEDCHEIFISYSWCNKEIVMNLYKKLTDMGFSCWIDTDKMEVGDNLFAEIDHGIRHCKTVIACVSPDYVASETCQAEINLAKDRKKRIIPLILKKTEPWPPHGSTAMIFTGLIYIGAYKNPEELNTWDGPNSQKLFSRLNEKYKSRKVTGERVYIVIQEQGNRSSNPFCGCFSCRRRN